MRWCTEICLDWVNETMWDTMVWSIPKALKNTTKLIVFHHFASPSLHHNVVVPWCVSTVNETSTGDDGIRYVRPLFVPRAHNSPSRGGTHWDIAYLQRPQKETTAIIIVRQVFLHDNTLLLYLVLAKSPYCSLKRRYRVLKGEKRAPKMNFRLTWMPTRRPAPIHGERKRRNHHLLSKSIIITPNMARMIILRSFFGELSHLPGTVWEDACTHLRRWNTSNHFNIYLLRHPLKKTKYSRMLVLWPLSRCRFSIAMIYVGWEKAAWKRKSTRRTLANVDLVIHRITYSYAATTCRSVGQIIYQICQGHGTNH